MVKAKYVICTTIFETLPFVYTSLNNISHYQVTHGRQRTYLLVTIMYNNVYL